MDTQTKYGLLSDALFYFDAMLHSAELQIINHEPTIYRKIEQRNAKFLTKLINIKLKKESKDEVDP